MTKYVATKHVNDRASERNLSVNMDKIMTKVEALAVKQDVLVYVRKDNVGIPMIKQNGKWIVKSIFNIDTKNARMNGGQAAATDQAKKRGQQLICVI